jgi:hypothetical protein
MTTRIKIKRGAGTPSGLTFGELAYDFTNKRLFIGITGGNALLANTDGGVSTFNGLTGAVSGVTVGGTNVFTALNTFNAGISAAGATFSGSVSAQSTLYTDNIQAIGNQINIANVASGRIAFGDYDSNGNSTFVFIRDATSSLLISNPYGDISIGDANNVDSGYFITYNAPAGYLDGGGSALTNWTSGSFGGLLTASAGISAAGSTFSGNVAMTSTSSYTGLASFSGGLSAAGGVTFNTSIQTTRLPRLSSSVFEAKTANWTPTNADDGKIFTVSIGGKSTITCTLNGLSPGVHFKILLLSGSITFSVTGTGNGGAITLGLSAPSSTTVYCTATDTYFGTDSA